MSIFASFVHCLPNILHTWSATRQPLCDATVDDLGDISRSLDFFTSNFSRTVRDTAKVTIDYRLLIGSHTLAFDSCFDDLE